MSGTAITVRIDTHSTELAPGSEIIAATEKLYRDAPDPLLELIRSDIVQGIPWRQAVMDRVSPTNPWLGRIVTDPARTLWLEQNPVRKDCLVLDVGAGWGQWTLPAAKVARVVAIEPNPARLAIIEGIVRQEGRSQQVYFVGAPLERIEFPQTKFDQIFCIGVLEWVPKFHPSLEPVEAQRQFLRRLRSLVDPSGECIIGIENRFGLKYLLGARDDHIGLSNISMLDADTAAQRYLAKTGQPLRVFTHTMREYEELLTETGFKAVEFFAAYPDYKVPQAILPIANGTANQHCLKGPHIAEHDGSDGAPLSIQEDLASHYRSLGALGIAGQFAPSFYIRARC